MFFGQKLLRRYILRTKDSSEVYSSDKSFFKGIFFGQKLLRLRKLECAHCVRRHAHGHAYGYAYRHAFRRAHRHVCACMAEVSASVMCACMPIDMYAGMRMDMHVGMHIRRGIQSSSWSIRSNVRWNVRWNVRRWATRRSSWRRGRRYRRLTPAPLASRARAFSSSSRCAGRPRTRTASCSPPALFFLSLRPVSEKRARKEGSCRGCGQRRQRCRE